MQLSESFGLAGGILVTSSIIPQLIRVFRLRSAREISILFTMFLILGMGSWLAYGLVLDLTQVVLWNAIGLVLVCALMYAKLKYGKG